MSRVAGRVTSQLTAASNTCLRMRRLARSLCAALLMGMPALILAGCGGGDEGGGGPNPDTNFGVTAIDITSGGTSLAIAWTNPNQREITGFHITWMNTQNQTDAGVKESTPPGVDVSAGARVVETVTGLMRDATYNITIATIYADGRVVAIAVPMPATTGGDSARDLDGDGISDATDNCLAIANADQINTDNANDGGDACDDDDDNDGVADETDTCAGGATGWTSNATTDHDSDGCRDGDEDLDDDNDGVADEADACARHATGWTSNATTDNDCDGCRDRDEDPDDGDGNSKPLPLNSLMNASLAAAKTDRWEIMLPTAGSLVVYTQGTLNTLGILKDPGGTVLVRTEDTDLNNFWFCRVLPAGTYYILVSATAGQGGEYKIQADFDEEGNCGITDFNQWNLDDYGIRNLHARGITGEGVRIAVVDGDVEIRHEDLEGNLIPGLSYDYEDQSDDPSPTSGSDRHGTAVTGIIVADADNGIGITGVAGKASFYALNLLKRSTMNNIANAMVRHTGITDISSNSWSACTKINRFCSPPILWEMAIEQGLQEGANGKGTVYVWAAGNDRRIDSSSNYNGYSNHYGVIAVCALNRQRQFTTYSESGANLWVCAPGGDGIENDGRITTTDLTGTGGYNSGRSRSDYSNPDYTAGFGGTSASAPFVAGVVALMRQVNANLTWRDVKLILAQTADQNDDPGWSTGAPVYDPSLPNSPAHYSVHSGMVVREFRRPDPIYSFHRTHDYGFGMINATKAVAAAAHWKPVPPMQPAEVYSSGPVGMRIPDINFAEVPYNIQLLSEPPIFVRVADYRDSTVQHSITVSDSNITFVEYIEIRTNIAHTDAGGLEIELVAPSGQVSLLNELRTCTGGNCGYLAGHRFGSALHLGENPNGNWTLIARDLATDHSGTLNDWNLKFYGH